MSTSVATPPPVLADDLCWLLARATQAADGRLGSALEASGGHLLRQPVLATAMTGEHTQTDLARMVGLDKTTMMHTLDSSRAPDSAELAPGADGPPRLARNVTPRGSARQQANAILGRVKEQVLTLLPAERRDGFPAVAVQPGLL